MKFHRALSNMMNFGEFDLLEAVVFKNENLHVAGKIVYAPIYMVMFLEKKNEVPLFIELI